MTKTHTFTNLPLTATPNTDIWRKPPSHDVFTATPTYLPLPSIRIRDLSRVLVTFNGAYKQQFDQAGVVLSLGNPSTSVSGDDVPGNPPSWIKSGIELYNGTRYLSFVGCDRWADWSVSPLRAQKPAADGSVSVELEVQDTTLWAYEVVVDETGEVSERYPIRECTWPLDQGGERRVKIGAYCCRPATEEVAGREVLEATAEKVVVVLEEKEDE